MRVAVQPHPAIEPIVQALRRAGFNVRPRGELLGGYRQYTVSEYWDVEFRNKNTICIGTTGAAWEWVLESTVPHSFTWFPACESFVGQRNDDVVNDVAFDYDDYSDFICNSWEFTVDQLASCMGAFESLAARFGK